MLCWLHVYVGCIYFYKHVCTCVLCTSVYGDQRLMLASSSALIFRTGSHWIYISSVGKADYPGSLSVHWGVIAPSLTTGARNPHSGVQMLVRRRVYQQSHLLNPYEWLWSMGSMGKIPDSLTCLVKISFFITALGENAVLENLCFE